VIHKNRDINKIYARHFYYVNVNACGRPAFWEKNVTFQKMASLKIDAT
jgi:hypothetical protein